MANTLNNIVGANNRVVTDRALPEAASANTTTAAGALDSVSVPQDARAPVSKNLPSTSAALVPPKLTLPEALANLPKGGVQLSTQKIAACTEVQHATVQQLMGVAAAAARDQVEMARINQLDPKDRVSAARAYVRAEMTEVAAGIRSDALNNAKASEEEKTPEEVEKEKAEKERAEALEKELDRLNVEAFDIAPMLMKIMGQLQAVRALAAQTRLKQRNEQLNMQLDAAQKIEDAGAKKYTQALIAGVTGIAAASVSALGTGLVARGADKIANATAGGISASDALKRAAMYETPRAAFVNSLSGLAKSGGEAAAGQQNVGIAQDESESQRRAALGQNLGSRAEEADRVASELTQSINKVLDSALQLNNTKNETVNSIAKNIA